MPRVEASASTRLHVETMYGHTQRTDLKWQKKVIYPLVRDAQACKKDISNGYQCERFAPFEARWHTMQNRSDKHKMELIFTLKILPKMVQKPAPRGPNGSQNPFWRPPRRPSEREDVFDGLEEASRTSFGRPFGSRKSFQTRPGSVSKTHVTSNTVLEWFWITSEADFEVNFEVSA